MFESLYFHHYLAYRAISEKGALVALLFYLFMNDRANGIIARNQIFEAVIAEHTLPTATAFMKQPYR
ncbi:MAG: hypothetical protein WBB36_02940, partial [Chitinophagales bacterium]